MPYLRVYGSDVPLAQKRLIAQKLIEITLRAFQLRAEDRHRISIQFIPLPRFSAVAGLEPVIPHEAGFLLEVNDHDLTEEKKRAFAEEAKPMLTQELATKPGSPLARLLGIKPDISRQVALQFNELNLDQLMGWDSAFLLEHRAA
jgi:hypothetical protein